MQVYPQTTDRGNEKGYIPEELKNARVRTRPCDIWLIGFSVSELVSKSSLKEGSTRVI
jgi:hypothetical protein